MYKDLRVVGRPTRKKPGMREFFILILCYSYFNKISTVNNEFSISEQVMADYFHCTTKTVYRWLAKLRDLGYLKYAERENAGKTGYYRVKDENGKVVRNSYVIPKYKKIRVGKPNEIKFVNIYTLDQVGLNDYFIQTINEDVFGHIQNYKHVFDEYISFLDSRHTIDELSEIPTEELTKDDKTRLKRNKNIESKLSENTFYTDKKAEQDKQLPEFTCKYLKEGCLRLTHELCCTVNPEHTEKIDESNYWRSSHARADMLKAILKTTDFEEYDVNGSIYRLTYNLYHDSPLDMDTDIYELIWNTAFTTGWPDNTYRNNFKKILMPIYMKEYLIAFKSYQYEYVDKYYFGHPIKYKRLPEIDKDNYELHKPFVELLGIGIKDFLTQVRDAMHKVLNTKKFIGSNIFIQESNLHILMREQFLNRHILCANIYDGFYFAAGQVSETDFCSVYNTALQQLKQNLKHGIGTPIP